MEFDMNSPQHQALRTKLADIFAAHGNALLEGDQTLAYSLSGEAFGMASALTIFYRHDHVAEMFCYRLGTCLFNHSTADSVRRLNAAHENAVQEQAWRARA